MYARDLERLDAQFLLDRYVSEACKGEILLRAKEWKKAFDKVCNDRGLVGSERESVNGKDRS